jgi:O-antigen/teichoic acid export membrane protein
VGFGASQVIRLGSNLILARYLVPADYGVMALANAVIIGLTLFSDLGTAQLIVQHRSGDEPRFYNTVWTLNVVRGCVLWGASCLLALPVATLYDAPVLISVLPVLGVTALMSGLSSTSLQILTRRLTPARAVVLNLVSGLLGAVLAVVWVLCVRADVWGFVLGNLASSFVLLVASHFLVAGHRNRPVWDRSVVAEVLRLGKWIFLSTVLTFLADQSDRLLLGQFCTLHDLGVFALAAQLCLAPVQFLVTLGSRVLLPLFSAWFRSGQDVSARFRRVRRAVLWGGTASAVGLLLFGPDLVRVLFGAKYADAGWMLRVLAVGMFFRIADVVASNFFLAAGRPRMLVVLSGLKVVALFVCVPVGFAVGGLPGAIFGFVAVEVLRYLVGLEALRRAGAGVYLLDAPFLATVVAVAVFILGR